ncbi:hypothetical protein FPV16_25540 [Methylobacterium sp. W2]|uniref:hypothetical protein n=1 Tax=Methylobacterium sp. W2 TaxID=2598107 RepID=UPI001D0C06D7|nr:hypothetical protein [Methylobacterium sp. W2]MCC0809522.1 hypothetical protein [Methylobacterium sp. W2]
MPDLTRSQFCELIKLPPETVKTMDRRWQLPFSIDQTTWGRGYSAFEAFLMITAQEFNEGHGVNLNRSAEIAAALPDVLAPKWSRIVETARQMIDGTGQTAGDIMCGRYSIAGVHPPRPIAGTDAEIDEELAATAEPIIRSIRSSASRSLRLLLDRCARQGIDIPEKFYSGPFIYRPRPNTGELMKSSMEGLIAAGVHLQPIDD